MAAASLVFLTLTAWRDWAFWRFALTTPSAWGLRSIGAVGERVVIPFLVVASVCVVAWAVGRRLLAALGAREDDGLSRLTAFALGLGCLAAGVAALAAAGLLGPWTCAAWLASTAAVGDWKAPRPRRPRLPALSPLDGALAGLLAYASFHGLALALAPAVEWDVLAYHLALPKIYLAEGRMRELPWLLHSHWPHLMETFYALPLSWGLETVPALLHLACGAAWTAAVYVFGRARLGPRAGLVAAVVAAVQPISLRILPTAHADGAVALFFLLSALALLAGFALSCKLLAAAPVAALAVLAWRGGGKRNWNRRDGAEFAGLAFLVASPWYLKAWLGTGNPVWPFFSRWLGGDFGASALEGAFLASNMRTWSTAMSALTDHGALFLGIPALLAGLLAWRRGAPSWLVWLWLPAVPFAAVVARHNEAWRFFLLFYPAAALTVAWAVSARPRLAWVLAAAALFPATRAAQGNQLFFATGARPERDGRRVFLERSLDHFSFSLKVPALLPVGSRILLFREIRGFYLDAPYVWGDPLNQGLLRYRDMSGPDELHARLAAMGITHVLVNEVEPLYQESPGYYDRRTLALMEALLAASGRVVLRENGLALYRLL